MPFDSGKDRIVLWKNHAPDLFSTPDSDNILTKSVGSGAFAAYLGAVLGVLNSLRVLTHFTPTNIAVKVVGLAAPFGAIGAAYPAITGIVANIRNKDDPLNHAIGGFVAGSILAVRSKNPATGWVSGFGFGLFCCINKFCHQNGFKLYSDEAFNKPATTMDFYHYKRSFLVEKGPILGRED